MNRSRAALILVGVLLAASCSEKTPAPSKPEAETEKKEGEQEPRDDQIAEDCVAFVHSTKVQTASSPAADCPGCPPPGTPALAFRQMKVDRISCSGATCEVTVTLRAFFNAGPAGTISGGLTAWIPQEQRLEYSNGHAPAGEQVYRVKIIYKRTGEKWRAIEFDRAEPK